MLAGLPCCSLKMSFVTPPSFPLPSPGVRGRGREEQGQWKTAEPEAEAEMGLFVPSQQQLGTEQKPCLAAALHGGLLSGASLCTLRWKEMPSHADEDAREDFCSGPWILWQSAQAMAIFLLSRHLFIEWRGGLSTSGRQSREINRALRELIMSCGTVPYLVTR